MMYLEMKKDRTPRSGSSWSRYKCVWSPTGTRAFWSKILQIREGNVIFHLIGDRPDAEFTAYSIASGPGFETAERPPDPGPWSYADRFFRADLNVTECFQPAVNLDGVFEARKTELKDYYERNSARGVDKLNIFYHIKQSGRLECTQGAYLSDIDDELLAILFSHEATIPSSRGRDRIVSVETSTQIASVRVRIGEERFSREIKRLYFNRCCFPGCSITDNRFLVAGHIDRWSGNKELRGNSGNGLCFCVLHDRAFELGLFTLDDQFQVVVNAREQSAESGCLQELFSYHGNRIKLAETLPLRSALSEHRRRVGINC